MFPCHLKYCYISAHVTKKRELKVSVFKTTLGIFTKYCSKSRHLVISILMILKDIKYTKTFTEPAFLFLKDIIKQI